MKLSISEEAELFARLVELDADARAPLLDGLDAATRQGLLELLALDMNTEDELEAGVEQALRDWGLGTVLEAGQRVGRFDVMRELGRGGVGEVWLVEFDDSGIRRPGALKVLRTTFLAREQQALWERERRLLARLSHPYIAGLIETGLLDSGEPYLLMEFIEGRRLDDAVVAMPLRERIALLRRICDAVSAAHRQLVVHRDLKPSNILITPDGLPKLVDFGIGQALDGSQPHLDAATRAFASPEQLAGAEPTTASDVYSLGKILACVLPEGHDIIAKATATDPADRYATVAALENDLRLWLEHRPISAHAPSLRYHLACLWRRHPVAIAGAMVALLLITAAAGIAWRQYHRAQTRSTELRELAGVAIFDLDREVQKLPGSLEARKLLLETALKYLSNLEAATQSDSSLRAELANAYFRTSQLKYSYAGPSLGAVKESIDLVEKSFALREALGQGNMRDAKTRIAYAATISKLADWRRVNRGHEEARILFAKGRQHLTEWERDEPTSPDLLEAWLYLDNTYTRLLMVSDPKQSLQHLQSVRPRLDAFTRHSKSQVDKWRWRATYEELLAGVAGHIGQAEIVRTASPAAIDAARQLYEADPSARTARTMMLIYMNSVLYSVDAGVADLNKLDQAVGHWAEVLASPDLPDRKDRHWSHHRAELPMARAWIETARNRPQKALELLAMARAEIDAAEKAEAGSFWSAMRRAQLTEQEAKLTRK